MRAVAAYAARRGVRAGVAGLDLRTGVCYRAGDYAGLFGSVSVMKVLIAVRLLATGQMHGAVAKLAYAMITRSDDTAANALWPLVGGPDVINQVKVQYRLLYLGTPNTRVGYWGNTHITARGMVYLYRAILADPATATWLYGAMHAAQKVAADGTDQFFGIAAATRNFAS